MSEVQETEELPRALLIAITNQSQGKEMATGHIEELKELTRTFGAETVDSVIVPLRKYDAATFFGSGKVAELVEQAAELGVDVVILDEEISPAQQRNLEKAFKLTVMDRTELIIAVFAASAHTREAKLQVELAEMKYQLPRLKRLWTHLHRQTGSGGSGKFLKGEGEKQIEIDRRILNTKIAKLETEIKTVTKQRETGRVLRKRNAIPTFAIIGYTNAGKSTLLNALTGAEVLIEDKLFATLDTTTRKLQLPNNQESLLIDTVGFIRKLPHQLVASFKSTLEESMEADILLHLIDVSDPFAHEHADAAAAVLQELNVENKPVITVLNKIDQLDDPSKLIYFKTKFPRIVAISAGKKEGFEGLLQSMMDGLKELRTEVRLRIPQSEFHHVSAVLSKGEVLHQEYEENDVLLRAVLPNEIAEKLSVFQY